MPKVTVIIPNYNHEKYLHQRIRSILNQTYQDIEVIILDDCSNDNSREIIESYRNEQLVSKIIINEENSGSPFIQWKRGIELATGDYIWIAESDDWCEPVFLETLISNIRESTVLAFAQSLVISGSNEILWNTKASFLEKDHEGGLFVETEMLTRNAIINASMCIFKKKCYFDVDPSFTSYKFCGDWLFWILIARQGDVFVSGKMLNYFRKHNHDVSGKAYQSGLFYWEYFRLSEALVMMNVITKNKRIKAVSEVMDRFLRDRLITDDITMKLMKEFRNLLGSLLFHKKIIEYKIFKFKKKWKGLR